MNLFDPTGLNGVTALRLGFDIFRGLSSLLVGLSISANPVALFGVAFLATLSITMDSRKLGDGTLTSAEVESNSNREESSPYPELEDPSGVEAGKDFTPTQKKKIIDVNKSRNGGEVKSDDPSDPFPNLVKPSKSKKGVTPPQNEWQIDHIIPKSKGGTNSYTNARVVSCFFNRLKWDN